MWNFLQPLSAWDWLALGAVLLILEIVGAGGYLLWAGTAAMTVGVLLFALPGLESATQLLLFALLCVLTATAWWHRQRQAGYTDQPLLNQRGQALIGRVFMVHEAIVDGRGKIKVGDGLWLIQGEDADVGSHVKVIEQRDVYLLVVSVVDGSVESQASN